VTCATRAHHDRGRPLHAAVWVAGGGQRRRAAGDATPVLAEDSSTVFALLDERRANLAAHRTRLVN
jgi:hypothetical protein